jgi:hypothetical protein
MHDVFLKRFDNVSTSLGYDYGVPPHKATIIPTARSYGLATTQTSHHKVVLWLQQGLPHIYGSLGYKV